jgi:hypothetical protein
MALAMHNYHDTHGRLPPAAVCGKDGKPLYSWRVALLPFIEEQALYAEFKLDEPWDSPHNLALLDRMPRVYGPYKRRSDDRPGYSYYRVFVGKGTAFEGPRGQSFRDFPDGTSNTILIAEAGEAVPWTKPEELPYAPDQPLPRMGGIARDGFFRIATGDGSVRDIGDTVSEPTLRAAITRNGGEQFGPDW